MKKVSLVLGILTILLFISSVRATGENWADINYKERVAIQITGTGKVQSEIILNSSVANVFMMQPNGCDLKFYANDNTTRLNHYLEYDTINISGNSPVRVDVANQSTIWLYYENTTSVICYSNPESISPAGIGDNYSASSVNTSKWTDIPAWGTLWGQKDGFLILNASSSSNAVVYSNAQLQSPNVTVKWAFNITINPSNKAWEMNIRNDDGTYTTAYSIKVNLADGSLRLMKLASSVWTDLGTINASVTTSQVGTAYIKQVGNNLTACVNTTATQACVLATDSTYTSGNGISMYKYIVTGNDDILKIDWVYAVNESGTLSYTFGSPEINPLYIWWNSSWIYRKPVPITISSGNLSNVTTTINVTYDSNMLANFSDIRFVGANGNLIGQYLINKTDSQFANYEVLIPSVNTTIMMYYGNAGATLYSNRRDSNLFWDDFSEGSINTTLWYENISTGTATIDDNTLYLQSGATGDTGETYCSISTFPNPLTLEFDGAPQATTSPVEAFSVYLFFYPDTGAYYLKYVTIYNNNGWKNAVYNNNITADSTYSNNTWYHFKLTGSSTTTNIYSNVTGSMVSKSSTAIGSTSPTQICFTALHPGGWNQDATKYDNIRAYTYTTGTVTYSFGTEETASIPVVNLIYPTNNNLTNSSLATITFNCSAIDGTSLTNMTLYGNWSGGWHANETQSITGLYNFSTFSKSLPTGTYTWNCKACDNTSQCSFASTNNTFTIMTYYLPIISISSPSGFYSNWNSTERTFNYTWSRPIYITNSTDIYSLVYSIDGGANISSATGNYIGLDALKHNITICGSNIIGEWGCNTTTFEVNGDVGEPKILFNYTMLVDRGLIYVDTLNSFDWDGDGVNEIAIGTSGNDASVWVLDNCSSPSCSQPYLPPRIVDYVKTTGGNQADRWIWKIQTGDMGGNDGVLNELCAGTGGVSTTYLNCYKWNGTWFEKNYSYATSLADVEILQFCNVNNSTKPQLFGSLYNQAGGGQMVIVQNYTDTSPQTLNTCRPDSAMTCQDIDSDGINETVIACQGNIAPSIQYIDWNGSNYTVKNIINSICTTGLPFFQGDDHSKCDYDGDGDEDVMVICIKSPSSSSYSNYTRFNATSLIDTHPTTPFIIDWGGKIADNRYPNECSVATSFGNRSIYRNISSNEVIFKGRPTEGSMQWFFNLWSDVDNDGYSEIGYAQYDGNQGNRTISLLDFSPLLLLPVITIQSPQNIIYNTTNIDLQVSADKAIDTWWYKLNGGTNSTFTPNTTITGIEGNNSLIVYANDSTGNIGFETVDFTVDSIAPTITIISPTVSSYNTTSIPLQVSANETINTWWFNLNGAGNTTFSPNITLPTPSQGSNLIIVYANDSSGNIGSSQVYFFVDSISPSVTITSPQNISYTITSIALQVSADETISLWRYKLNGGTNTTFSPNTTITAIQGSNNIIVYATDTIGNIGSSTISFFVDSISPSVIITSPQNISYTTTSIPLNVTANEAIDTWIYSLNGGANTTLTPNITITASQGNNNITIWANDSYGNLNTSIIHFFVDSIPPTITIYSPQNITYNNVSQTDLNVSASEPVDSWWYSINGGSNTTFTPNSTINMANGSNTLIVYSNDTAGNIGTTSVSFTANYPTVTTLISPNNGNSTISSVPINMTFICSAINDINLMNMSLYFGSNTIAWHLNETKSVTGISNSSTFVKMLPIGNYTWSCYSCDYADQCSWGVPNWTISITAPTPVHFGLIDNLGQFGFLAGIAIGAGILMFLVDIFFGSMAEALKNPKKFITLIIGVVIMVAIFSMLF